MSATIRLASAADLPTVVAIYNEAVAERYATADLSAVTLDQRVAWFREHDPPRYPVYVLEERGVIRGWCSLSAYRPGRAALLGTAEISYYVASAARGQGVGTALVRHAVNEAPGLGKRVLFGI